MSRINTESLRIEAEAKGIFIEDLSLPETGSMTVRMGAIYIIGIDTGDMTEAQHRTHLAHEMGHCETGAVYDIAVPLETRSRCEFRANKWAIKKLLPKEELEQAFRQGLVEIWQLAEHFDVTEDLVRFACEYYFNKY